VNKLSSRARHNLEGRVFAFQADRKEPLENATHVRNAVARFMQVTQVTDAQRDAAWERILRAARQFHVAVHQASWRDLSRDP
jgi:phosphoribosylanthranilate isomerase